MNNSNDIWAIIPTRGGSIGLPNKNIAIIAGRPLLDYMLEAAKGSKLLNRVILTTDNDDIARAAKPIRNVEIRKHNAALSVSGQPSFGVFKNTLESLFREAGFLPKIIVLLRVTTPLCISSDIDNAITMLLKTKSMATAVLSVTKSDVHPKRVYVVDSDNFIHAREATPEQNHPMPRQVFDDVYIRNGAIYATFPEVVLNGSLWGERPLAYIMPKERSINVNDEIDFILAESLLNRQTSAHPRTL